MDQRKIEKAILKGRLPLRFIDCVALSFCVVYGTGAVYIIFKNVADNLIFLFYTLVGVAILIYYFLSQNKLTTYNSDKSLASKEEGLNNLVKNLGGFGVKSENNYFTFYISGGWFDNSYLIRIIFTDTAYYIISRYNKEKSSFWYGTNNAKIQEVIDHLKSS